MVDEYKNQSLLAIRDMAHYHGSEMTLGEIMYSVLRKSAQAEEGNIKFLLSITDKQFYSEVSRAVKEEKEDEYFDPKEERKRQLKDIK